MYINNEFNTTICSECGGKIIPSGTEDVCSQCGLVANERQYENILSTPEETQIKVNVVPKTPEEKRFFKKIEHSSLYFRDKSESTQIAIEKQLSILATMYDFDKSFCYKIVDEANKIPKKFLKDNRIDKRELVFSILVSKLKVSNNIDDVIDNIRSVTSLRNFKRRSMLISLLLQKKQMKEGVVEVKNYVQENYIKQIEEIFKKGVLKTNIKKVKNQDQFKTQLISNGIRVLKRINYDKMNGLNPKTVASYVLYKVVPNRIISKTKISQIFTITRPTLVYAIRRFGI